MKTGYSGESEIGETRIIHWFPQVLTQGLTVFFSFQGSLNVTVTTSPALELTMISSIRKATKTISIQPSTTTFLTHPGTHITASSTPLMSSVSVQRSVVFSSARQSTVHSSVIIETSQSSLVRSVISSSRSTLPTLPSVSSSMAPRGEEVKSLNGIFLRTEFLVGTAVAGVIVLLLIIVLLVVRRKR